MKINDNKKKESIEVFKSGKLEEALKKFDECLAIDELNAHYNSAILFNKAITLINLNTHDNLRNDDPAI